MQGWTRGALALIGDAAHAMLPFAAQGAAMAIEDAAVLARALRPALASSSDMATCLASWGAQRMERVERARRLALANRAIYHLPDALCFPQRRHVGAGRPETSRPTGLAVRLAARLASRLGDANMAGKRRTRAGTPKKTARPRYGFSQRSGSGQVVVTCVPSGSQHGLRQPCVYQAQARAGTEAHTTREPSGIRHECVGRT